MDWRIEQQAQRPILDTITSLEPADDPDELALRTLHLADRLAAISCRLGYLPDDVQRRLLDLERRVAGAGS